ncbi:MAG: hypothetical protein WKF77_13740 [Planctomycetaceae bacterium]
MPSTVAFAAGYRNNLPWTAGISVKKVPTMAVSHYCNDPQRASSSPST